MSKLNKLHSKVGQFFLEKRELCCLKGVCFKKYTIKENEWFLAQKQAYTQ